MNEQMENTLNKIFNVLLLLLLTVSIGFRKGLAIFLIVAIFLDPIMRKFVLWRTLKSGILFWIGNVILLELILGAFGIHVRGIFMNLVFFGSFIGAYKMNKMLNSYTGFQNGDDFGNDFDLKDDFYKPNNDDISDYTNSSSYKENDYENRPSKNNERPL